MIQEKSNLEEEITQLERDNAHLETKNTHLEAENNRIKCEKDQFEGNRACLLCDKTNLEKEKTKLKIDLDTTNDKLQKSLEGPFLLSYHLLKVIYEQIVGTPITLNQNSTIKFYLNDEKWMRLLTVLSYFKSSSIDSYWLHNLPQNSDVVRTFLRQSVSKQKNFYFNCNKFNQLNASYYFNELKEVAKNIEGNFYIYYMNFSVHEFCEFISACKHIPQLHINGCIIPFDYEFSFGENMDGCNIQYISLCETGLKDYSDWIKNPHRFENFIKAVSKCDSLVKSLKYLYIGRSGISREFAQATVDKYGLNEIKFQGL